MPTTTNYGWTTPADTDLVKDGASAIRTLGSAIDTTTKNLNPQTTLGDLAYRSSTANTNTRLAVGSNGQVLTVSSGVPTWATPTAAALTKVVSASFSNVANTGTTFDGCFTSTYDNYIIYFNLMYASTNTVNLQFQTRNAGSTQGTGGDYYGSFTRGTTLVSTTSGTSFNMLNLTNVSTQTASASMHFYRNTTKIAWNYLAQGRGTGNEGMFGGGFNDAVSALGSDGFILSASSGNIYGTVTVYGVQK